MRRYFGYLSVEILLGPFAVMWGGFALSTLWGWFIVPFGLPAIGVAQAIGLALLGRLLSGGPGRGGGADEDISVAFWCASLSRAIVAPAAALAIGWVVTLFM